MRYSDKIKVKHLTPAGMPIAAIPDRNEAGELVGVIDIYPMQSKDIFWLVQKAPTVVAAFAMGENNEERVSGIAAAACQAGIEVLNYLLARALGATLEEIQDPEAPRSLEFDADVLEAFFMHGVPQDFFEKLVGGLNKATGGKATQFLMMWMSKAFSANTSPMSSTPSQANTTSTTSPSTS